MPWCPKCKTEYRDGVTACPDCGSRLVEELPEEKVCIASLPEETALGLVAYYEYLGVDYCALDFDQESGKYRVLVPASRAEEIQKPTEQYFAKLRAEKAVPEEHEASAQTKVSGSPYQKKKDQLEDVRSTASAFLAVGIIGMVLIVLILAGVIPFPFAASSKVLMLSVMSLLFLVFIGIGIHSAQKVKGLRQEAKEEDDRTSQILSWFTATYTRADIEEDLQLQDSNEINYYARTNRIRELIRREYALNEDYMDTLAETLYEHYYES